MSKKDTLSKLKEEAAMAEKKDEEQNEDELEDNEEEQHKDEEGVVKEQTSSSINKPKNLAELLGDSKEGQAKLAPKTQKPKKKPNDNKGKGGNKPSFFNSKKKDVVSTGYVAGNDESEKRPQYKNSKKVGQKTMEAPKTKDYLDKDIPKTYQEDNVQQPVPKPEFKGLKAEGEEKFADLNTNEDLFLKNLEKNKDMQLKNDYKSEEKGEKKRYPKKEHKRKNQEPTNDVDSDGFEVVGTKEEHRREIQERHRQNPNRRGRGGRGFHRGGKGGDNHHWERKKEEEKKEGENKDEEKKEEKEETKKEEKKKGGEKKKKEPQIQKDGNTVTIKIKTEAKSLKDLLG
ncbi:MAG: hypothetical protein MJ252_21160 [archaeon]|nr:hypothetical protein [archaeon]